MNCLKLYFGISPRRYVLRQSGKTHTCWGMSLITLRHKICVKKRVMAVVLCPWSLNTQEMCIKAIEEDPHMLKDVLAHFKTQEMCIEVVKKESLMHILDRSQDVQRSSWGRPKHAEICHWSVKGTRDVY